MTKKAKGQGSMGSMVNYHELKKHAQDYGTKEARFGVDSQLPFGYCALTLAPVVEPVVTPSGHVYSREPMFEYLLAKGKELKRQRALYDAQEAERAIKMGADIEAAASAQTDAFVKTQTLLIAASSSSASAPTPSSALVAVGSSSSAGPTTAGSKRKLAEAKTEEDARSAAVAELSKDVGDKVTSAQLKGTSYWLPQFQPEHRKEKIAEPPARPPSPNTGRPLRLKDLCPVNLKVDQDTANLLDKKYVCAVSGKQITYQDVVLLKKANAVCLERVWKDLGGASMICPLTSEKLKTKDIIKLKKPGSSFAAGGSVQAQKYNHTIT